MADAQDDDAIAIAPDELAEHVIKSLAYNGNLGASLEDMWRFAGEKVGVLDDFQKNALWGWLMESSSDIVVSVDMIPLSEESYRYMSFADIIEKYGDKLRLLVTEELQWLTLTGKPKEGNPIGAMTFQLLCLISAARERGITNVEIVRQSGQDARSLHGRTGALLEQGLIQRLPVIADKCNTFLNVYRKFYKKPVDGDDSQAATGLNTLLLRRSIVNAVKAAKNGLRPVEDLKREFGFDKQSRDHRYFSKTVRRLEAEGYVRRVIAVISGQRSIRAKCVQYMNDLPDDEGSDSSLNGDRYSDNEELIEADTLVEDTQDDTASATDIVNSGDSELKIVEQSTAQKDYADKLIVTDSERRDSILFNTIYPLEAQILYAISRAGINGISVRDICRNVTGVSYMRMVSRLIDQFVARGNSASNKKSVPVHLKNLELVRGTDFDARTKFYRFFTQTTFCQYAQKKPSPDWGTLGPALRPAYHSPRELNMAYRSKLPSNVKIIADHDGNESVAFHGDSDLIDSAWRIVELPDLSVPIESGSNASTSQTGKKRGRPRKDAAAVSSTGNKRGRPPKRPKEEKSSSLSDETSTKETIETRGSDPDNAPPQTDIMHVDTTEETNLEMPRGSSELGESEPITAYVRTEEPVDVGPGTLGQAKGLGELLTSPSNAILRGDRRALLRQNLLKQSQPAKKVTVPSGGVNHPGEREESNADLSFNFGQNKRDKIILGILEKNSGVMEAGVQLGKLMKDETNETVDRRTLASSVDRLSMKGRILCLKVSTGGSRDSISGLSGEKTIIVDPSIPLDDPRIIACKKAIIKREKARYKNPIKGPKAVSHIESEFVYYSITDKNTRIARAIDRLSRVAAAPTASSVSKGHEDGNGHYTDRAISTAKSSKISDLDDSIERSVTPMGETEKQGRVIRRSRLSHNGLEQDLFYRVVMISRSIYYSSAGIINWDVILRCWKDNVAEMTQEQAKSLWQRSRDAFGGSKFTERSFKRWESIFLSAYERGEFGVIDDPSQVDLFRMAKYWRAREGELSDRNSVYLYDDYDTNYRDLNIIDRAEKQDIFDLVAGMTSMVRTDELLTEYAFGYSKSDTGAAIESTPEGLQTIQQAIKSIVATDEDAYDATVASNIIGRFDEAQVGAALRQLEEHKVIVHTVRDKEKPTPGPAHSFSDRFLSQLFFKVGYDMFQKATEADNQLISILKEANATFKVPSVSTDAELLSIIELTAFRRVALLRSNTPTAGTLVEGYKSRHIDKEKLDFEVILKSLNVEPRARQKKPSKRNIPGVGKKPSCYTWVDINGNVSKSIWLKILSPFIWTIAMRPGITIAALYRKWATVLTYQELVAILGHLSKCGSISTGAYHSYSVQEGWFNGIAI